MILIRISRRSRQISRNMANYNKLVNLMGEHQQMTIFRRFQKLNIKSLLYMQAEILHMEQELYVIELEDKESEEKCCASLHASLFNLKESSGALHNGQWSKVKEIQEKLLAYSMFQSLTTSLEYREGRRYVDVESSKHSLYDNLS